MFYQTTPDSPINIVNYVPKYAQEIYKEVLNAAVEYSAPQKEDMLVLLKKFYN